MRKIAFDDLDGKVGLLVTPYRGPWTRLPVRPTGAGEPAYVAEERCELHGVIFQVLGVDLPFITVRVYTKEQAPQTPEVKMVDANTAAIRLPSSGAELYHWTQEDVELFVVKDEDYINAQLENSADRSAAGIEQAIQAMMRQRS